MISKLFRSRARRDAGPTGAVPPGLRVYAIGDIHGRLDLLEQLLSQIETDNAARPDAKVQLVFLGDLIDRGPHSADVVELMMGLKRQHPDTRFLMGNHEEVFLLALGGDKKALRFFTRIGGRETILSYGISPEQYDSVDFDELLVLAQARVPTQHGEFLASFEDMVILGDYAFVHAGIHPDIPLGSQKTSDLRWIREKFLDHPGPHEKIIVHGHSISADVEVQNNRIGLDTGAYASGRLTAMGLEGDSRWVLQT